MNLANVLRKWRLMMEMDPPEAAKNIGIPTKTLTTFERSGRLAPEAIAPIMKWLFSDRPAETQAPEETAEEDTKAAVGTNTKLWADGKPVEDLLALRNQDTSHGQG